MPQYLRIADNVYKRFEEEDKFNYPLQDCLNLIVKQLCEELKDTDLRLLYNHIDFVEGFQDKPDKRSNYVDVSLVPNYLNKEEFILWLASFIEKITEGGVKKLPALFADIPPDVNFESDILKILLKNLRSKSSEVIAAYFKSQNYN
ncbi:hypothetical protein F889_01919 [Acinetobacter colistiniresistens]|uniref:Uncharacterized protein n=1 Tax=Acinetobacter colistiniresistens TaxID=280145 RepID=N9QX69_9GAMM|nr:hypothetical protein [Acinetobacter colistiniresistens]ENX34631.1 hypothetical protein F889_01919 [Acinetobacter colistiniresistens]